MSRGDYHIHTCLRPIDDGAPEMTPETIARACRSRGFTSFGLSPHLHHDADPKALTAFLDDAKEKSAAILPMYRGIETECIDGDGTLTVTPELAERLDYVIASADHFNCTGVVRPPRDAKSCFEFHQKLLMKLAVHPLVDVIAHPFAGLILLTTEGHLPGYEPIIALNAVTDSWLDEFAAALRESGTAVELNGFFTLTYLERLNAAGRPYSYEADYFRIFRHLAGAGVSFSAGSDAHRPEDLSQFDSAFDWAERLAIPPDRMWTPEKLRN